MSFNPSKCNTINITRKDDPIVTVYTLKNEPLENVKVASYLGVQISRDVSWHSHVAKITSKGNKSLGFVRRNIRTTSEATKNPSVPNLSETVTGIRFLCLGSPFETPTWRCWKGSTQGCPVCLWYLRATSSYNRYTDGPWMGYPWTAASKGCCHHGVQDHQWSRGSALHSAETKYKGNQRSRKEIPSDICRH